MDRALEHEHHFLKPETSSRICGLLFAKVIRAAMFANTFRCDHE